MPVVDVEPAVLRSFQSPSNGGLPSKSGLTYSHRPSTPSVDEKQVDSTTLSPGFGSVSNELIRVGPTISTPAASPVSISSLTKRPDSAPVLKGVLSSRPRIIIRLTSVDGLELNLTSPRQENLLQPPDDDPTGPVRPVRCGAARPQHQQAVPLIPRKSRQFHPQFVLFLFGESKKDNGGNFLSKVMRLFFSLDGSMFSRGTGEKTFLSAWPWRAEKNAEGKVTLRPSDRRGEMKIAKKSKSRIMTRHSHTHTHTDTVRACSIEWNQYFSVLWWKELASPVKVDSALSRALVINVLWLARVAKVFFEYIVLCVEVRDSASRRFSFLRLNLFSRCWLSCKIEKKETKSNK